MSGDTGRAVPTADDRAAIMKSIKAFYAAFDEGFSGPADYATDDWNHISPLGGRKQDKSAVIEEVRAVHQTFLKGVTDTIKASDVRFADRDVAVATVTSVTSPQALPTDPVVRSRDQIRTFVMVRRGGKWLIMQDHNTFVAPVPAQTSQPLQ